jgi:hypothetical protein
MQYFEAEIKKDTPPDKAIRQSFKNIERISQKVLQDGENWVPFYCAFVSYELGKALHVWEKARGKEQAPLLYKNLTDHVLASEWTHPSGASASLPTLPRSVSVTGLKPLAATLARLPYFLIKGTMLLRKLRPGRR